MALLNADKISFDYGDRPLLEQCSFEIERGQRVCVVGRNGEGKSSLLKILDGAIQPDSGSLFIPPKTQVASLEQAVPDGDTRPVFDVIADALNDLKALMDEYQELTGRLETEHDDQLVNRLGELQHILDAKDAWVWESRVEDVILQLHIPRDAKMNSLSGGYKRRVLLGRALVASPDLLLLDEPTNHLDIDSVQWLEGFLTAFSGAIIFVTHDRQFLQNLATDIFALDRGKLDIYPGNYKNYLRRKAEKLAIEETHNALFDKKLAQEEVWIRQGIKARRTRNEGRVRALEALRLKRRARVEQQKTAKLRLASGEKSGKLVAELKDISFAYPDNLLISNFSSLILRGDRIGILGSNGIGKSTLLKIILGKLEPQSGTVKHGTKLEVAYFDQQRATLDFEKTVIDNLDLGSEQVEIDGKTKHVIGYLQDFLFSPQRARSPVKSLSGGECNRLLLARLFTRPANILVMDEPTNDLDVETLELLEELLIAYKGTLLVVSHDRAFLDNVITSTLVFEGNGQINEYVGGYSDWKKYADARNPSSQETKENRALKKPKAVKQKKQTNNKKLKFKEEQELKSLPGKIEVLDAEKTNLESLINEPDFYKNDHAKVNQKLQRLDEINGQLEIAYARWEKLES